MATKRQQEKIAKEAFIRDQREAERRQREQNNQNYDSGDDNYGGESSIGEKVDLTHHQELVVVVVGLLQVDLSIKRK